MYKLTYFLRDYIFLFSFTVADKGSKTFLSGEMYCSFRNRANSKTNTKIQNKKNNGKNTETFCICSMFAVNVFVLAFCSKFFHLQHITIVVFVCFLNGIISEAAERFFLIEMFWAVVTHLPLSATKLFSSQNLP